MHIQRISMQVQVPRANTEGTNTASVIGCTYYVAVGIIWSIIWYVGLDPIKWVMAYILNEDGFRDRKVRHSATASSTLRAAFVDAYSMGLLRIDILHASQAHHASQDRRSGVTPKDPNEISGVVGGGYNNPLGRASLAGPVAPAGPDQAPALARASVVGVKKVRPRPLLLCRPDTPTRSRPPLFCHHTAVTAQPQLRVPVQSSMGVEGPALAVRSSLTGLSS